MEILLFLIASPYIFNLIQFAFLPYIDMIGDMEALRVRLDTCNITRVSKYTVPRDLAE